MRRLSSRAREHGRERILRIFEIVTIVATSIILAYLAAISIWGLEVLWAPSTEVKEPYTVIRVEAFQFGWRFIYPNGTTSVETLYLEKGKLYRLDITSRDVAHSFFVPELGLKMDAIPGYINTLWVKVDKPGQYVIVCAELCGFGHYAMIAYMVVQ
ncbi:MAG: cytochrome c oxidase subunit II [Desulfurococcales archaeon]|nr:cytochrome c oxidase subunit II [Desulfurococcales archaeon]